MRVSDSCPTYFCLFRFLSFKELAGLSCYAMSVTPTYGIALVRLCVHVCVCVCVCESVWVWCVKVSLVSPSQRTAPGAMPEVPNKTFFSPLSRALSLSFFYFCRAVTVDSHPPTGQRGGSLRGPGRGWRRGRGKRRSGSVCTV